MRLRSIVAIDPTHANLDAALASEADAILVSVADGRTDVAEARTSAARAIAAAADAGKPAYVVVNHPRTRMLRDDLDALVSPALTGVFLAHTIEPQDMRDLAVLLREFELTRGIEPGHIVSYPVIASARGLLRAVDITQAIARDSGIVFDAEAYAYDVGARPEEMGHRLAWARGAIVAAARAQEGDPIIWPMPMEPRDSYQQGFSGAVLKSVSDVALANFTYTPPDLRIERAREQVAAYEAARAEGAWVARYRGGIVDAHTARKARLLLADYAGVEAPDDPETGQPAAQV